MEHREEPARRTARRAPEAVGARAPDSRPAHGGSTLRRHDNRSTSGHGACGAFGPCAHGTLR